MAESKGIEFEVKVTSIQGLRGTYLMLDKMMDIAWEDSINDYVNAILIEEIK